MQVKQLSHSSMQHRFNLYVFFLLFIIVNFKALHMQFVVVLSWPVIYALANDIVKQLQTHGKMVGKLNRFNGK